MKFSYIYSKWKKLVIEANDHGIPLPMVRDPQTLEGSVSLTLVMISTILVTAGIIGKWGGWLGGIDIASAFNFFYASCTLYFGHNWVHKENEPKSTLKVDESSKADDPDAK